MDPVAPRAIEQLPLEQLRAENAALRDEIAALVEMCPTLRDQMAVAETEKAPAQAAVNRLTDMLWGRRSEKRTHSDQPTRCRRRGGRIIHAACNSHARREFIAAERSHPREASKALAFYKLLYDVETVEFDTFELERMVLPSLVVADASLLLRTVF